jgi:hypothetical protein
MKTNSKGNKIGLALLLTLCIVGTQSSARAISVTADKLDQILGDTKIDVSTIVDAIKSGKTLTFPKVDTLLTDLTSKLPGLTIEPGLSTDSGLIKYNGGIVGEISGSVITIRPPRDSKSLPDAGATLVLLSMGLLGLAGLARNLKNKN